MAITLQRIPHAGGDPETRSLKDWGLAFGSLDSEAWMIGQLTLTASGESPAFSDPVFEYLDTIKVFEGETCIWWGPVVSTSSTVQAAEQRTYTVADPLWWAQFTAYKYPYTPEPEDLDTERGSYWLAWALIQSGIAYEPPDLTAFTAPCPDLRGSANCLELIQRVARLHPGSAQWWDLSGSAPKLRCALRSSLAAVDLARARCQEPITLSPLHDQQLTGVAIDYVFTTYSGQTTRSVAADIAGPGPYDGPNSLAYSVKVGTDSPASNEEGAANYDAAYAAAAYGVADLLYEARAALPWAGTLTVVGTPTNPLPTIRPGQLLNLTGGRTEWASMNAQVQRIARTIGEKCDRLTIELGLGEQLGPTDFASLARAGGVSGGAGGGNPNPWDNPTPPPPPNDNPTPGTYNDLNNTGLGGTPSGTVAVQARGGSWSLCGHQELTRAGTYRQASDGYEWHGAPVVASVPPRRYRRWAGAGTVTTTYYYPGCVSAYTTPPSAITAVGAHVISADTCDATQNDAAGMYLGEDRREDYTRTSMAISVDTGGCLPVNAGYHARVSGSQLWTLTDEDTDDDAIARLLAAEPAWAGGMTGIRTIRATGVTGVYRELRYRTEHTETAGQQIWREGYYDTSGAWVPGRWETITVTTTEPTLTGLRPWGRYQLTVHLQRRPVDEAGAATGPWEDAGDRTHYVRADLDGEGGIDWQIEEPPAGFELAVADSDFIEA